MAIKTEKKKTSDKLVVGKKNNVQRMAAVWQKTTTKIGNGAFFFFTKPLEQDKTWSSFGEQEGNFTCTTTNES